MTQFTFPEATERVSIQNGTMNFGVAFAAAPLALASEKLLQVLRTDVEPGL